jgi:hypothetical protein
MVFQIVLPRLSFDLCALVRSEGFGVIEVDGVHVLTCKPGQEPRYKATDDAKSQSALPPSNQLTQHHCR